MGSDKPSRQDEAADWFAAERAGIMLAEKRAEFDQWRRDPRNQAALDAMRDLWDDLAVLKAQRPAPARALWPSRAVMGAAAGIVLLVGVSVAWMALASPARIETRPGQQATQSLPDGSLIAVNVASHVSYEIGEEQRVVTIDDGEAAFTVKADAARPFVVRAGDYEIRATGTAFNVRQRGGTIEVGVSEGKVEICSVLGPEAGETLASLMAGQMLRFPAAWSGDGLRAAAPARVDPGHISEWRERVVTYEDASVREVIEDFNRYFDRKLLVEDRDLLDRRVTIRLEVEDRERAIELLAGMLELKVSETKRGEMLVE